LALLAAGSCCRFPRCLLLVAGAPVRRLLLCLFLFLLGCLVPARVSGWFSFCLFLVPGGACCLPVTHLFLSLLVDLLRGAFQPARG
jgi:hypothetical protein